MRQLLISSALAFATIMGSCATYSSSGDNAESSPAGTEQRTIAEFNKVETSSGIRVAYTYGTPSTTAEIEGPEWILPYVVTNVSNGKLKVGLSDNYFKEHNSMKSKVTVSVSSKVLNSVKASSGASFRALNRVIADKGFEGSASSGASIYLSEGLSSGAATELSASSGASITADALSIAKLEADASSGSSMKLENVTATEVEIDLSSAAGITMTGSAHELEVDASSASSFNGKKFFVEYADVEASSAASINYNAQKAKASKSSGGSCKNHN